MSDVRNAKIKIAQLFDVNHISVPEAIAVVEKVIDKVAIVPPMAGNELGEVVDTMEDVAEEMTDLDEAVQIPGDLGEVEEAAEEGAEGEEEDKVESVKDEIMELVADLSDDELLELLEEVAELVEEKGEEEQMASQGGLGGGMPAMPDTSVTPAPMTPVNAPAPTPATEPSGGFTGPTGSESNPLWG